MRSGIDSYADRTDWRKDARHAVAIAVQMDQARRREHAAWRIRRSRRKRAGKSGIRCRASSAQASATANRPAASRAASAPASSRQRVSRPVVQRHASEGKLGMGCREPMARVLDVLRSICIPSPNVGRPDCPELRLEQRKWLTMAAKSAR